MSLVVGLEGFIEVNFIEVGLGWNPWTLTRDLVG
jgi:hypothetical protein